MNTRANWLKGVITPVVTPFEKNEDVDYQALRSVVDFLIEKKVNCLFPLGATSEFHRLTLEEKKKVIDVVVDQANGKIPVMPGCHSLGTKLSIELAKYAKDAGAKAICLLQPYGMDALSEDRLFEHFKDVSDAVDLPMMLYAEVSMVNAPSLELVNKLANLDSIIGIKLSTSDLYKFQRGVKLFGDRIAVCTGEESVYLFGLMVGGAGGTLGTSNMIPEYWVKMYELFSKGLLKEALEMHNHVTIINDVIEKFGFRETVKEALNLRGIRAGRTRRPGRLLPSSARSEVAQMLKHLGIETRASVC